jgi:hypothetical protein
VKLTWPCGGGASLSFGPPLTLTAENIKGVRNVTEHHFGWTFDQNSNPTGYFTLVQTVKLNHDGTAYSGPFDRNFMT